MTSATDNRTTELLPCPFCGGKAMLYSDYSSELDETRWNLFHECDGHKGESAGYGSGYHPWFETPWYKTEDEAIEAWNTRSVETCHNDIDGDENDFACSVCRARLYIKNNDDYTMILKDKTLVTMPNYCPNCGRKVDE